MQYRHLSCLVEDRAGRRADEILGLLPASAASAATSSFSFVTYALWCLRVVEVERLGRDVGDQRVSGVGSSGRVKVMVLFLVLRRRLRARRGLVVRRLGEDLRMALEPRIEASALAARTAAPRRRVRRQRGTGGRCGAPLPMSWQSLFHPFGGRLPGRRFSGSANLPGGRRAARPARGAAGASPRAPARATSSSRTRATSLSVGPLRLEASMCWPTIVDTASQVEGDVLGDRVAVRHMRWMG